ncbi:MULTISPECIES: helix-turn-helix transcriptional regulator [unclassified Nocardioides]|uniref:helix-turn-helix transcriptional regulator n=1 Tax=unclassified Nocardioides TaxID=2615069 RepID=UPI0030146DED
MTQKELADLLGVSINTVGNWVGPKPRPDAPKVESLLRLHQAGLYPIAEQIMDLGDIGDEELRPVVPVWHPRNSLVGLVEQFNELVVDASKTEPDGLDFTRTLLQSCRESGDIGRWRARVFDIVHGWHMPYLGGQGVEFLRWYGPNALVDRRPRRTHDFLDSIPGPEDAWKKHVGGELQKAVPPPGFLPDEEDESQRLVRWDAFRWERMELIARIVEPLRASQADFIGGWGHGGTALLRNKVVINARHLMTLPPTMSVPEDPLALARPDVHLILVVGPGSLSPTRTATRIAEALGWRHASNRTLSHALTGHRSSLVARRTQDDERVLRYLTALPTTTPPLVVSINYRYLFTSLPGPSGETEQVMLPGVEMLFRSPGVLPVLLSHDRGNASSALWEDRIRYGRGKPQAHESATERVALRQMSQLVDLAENVTGSYMAEVQATHLNGGAPVGEDELNPARWFIHPVNGDTILRTAYEIAVALRRGRPVTGSGARETFHRASVLDRYRDVLAAATGGELWRDPAGWLECNQQFGQRPDPRSLPPRARVVDLIIR